jgi:hypothetical protein
MSAAVSSLRGRARLLAGTAATGLGVGVLVTALVCAAYAAQNLNTGWRPVDWLLGVILIASPILGLRAVLRLAAALATRLLTFLQRRAPAAAGRLAAALAAAVKPSGHPLTASTLAVAWMVWLSPSDGPLAMYHNLFYFEIPILGGAAAGLLAGAGIGLQRASPGGRVARASAVAGVGLALVVAGGIGAWAVFPGFGDGLVAQAAEPRAALERVAHLELPDPSLPGPYEVAFATYGSGSDGRRPEYGSAVTWTTPTVDASAALPERSFPADRLADWFWGYDDTRLPLNALVWYPSDAPGRLPVALIAHGNHAAGEFSDPGYAYLGAHLASHGIITASIDQNYLNGDSFYDYGGSEIGVRAWLLLRHAQLFVGFDGTAGHPLQGRVDSDRVALLGHSRGGEAATVAAMLSQRAASAVRIPGLPDTPTGFRVNAVVAIAPSDTMYSGPGRPVAATEIDYLLIQGARDGDLPGFDGLAAYHRVDLGSSGSRLKVAVYSSRANHGRFNSVWDYGDAGPVASWLLDRGALLSAGEQQDLAKAVIGAFLRRSLLGETGYDAFFREPRAGRAWLPDDTVETHWQTSSRATVEDCGQLDRDAIDVTEFETAKVTDIPLRDGLAHLDRACFLTWNGPATFAVSIAAGTIASPSGAGALVFAMVETFQTSGPPDPVIVVTDLDGTQAALRLSDVAPPRPLIPVQLWKAPGLGDRYAPDERLRWPAERFAQTYAIPLSRFVVAAPGLDIRRLERVAFRFDGSGSVYIDDIGFEDAVTP